MPHAQVEDEHVHGAGTEDAQAQQWHKGRPKHQQFHQGRQEGHLLQGHQRSARATTHTEEL